MVNPSVHARCTTTDYLRSSADKLRLSVLTRSLAAPAPQPAELLDAKPTSAMYDPLRETPSILEAVIAVHRVREPFSTDVQAAFILSCLPPDTVKAYLLSWDSEAVAAKSTKALLDWANRAGRNGRSKAGTPDVPLPLLRLSRFLLHLEGGAP